MAELKQIVRVGIADMKTVKSPDTIRTSGLGSCVGLVLFDGKRKHAGMVHVMLPESSLSRTEQLNEAKFADTGVKALVEQLIKEGASKSALKAKMAGGAQMFQYAAQKDTMRIGPRNVEAVTAELKKYGIPLVAKDVGGNSGRTIEFDPENGQLFIRTVNAGQTVL